MKDIINLIRKTILGEKGKLIASYGISRWDSEADRLADKIYPKEEAMKLFGIEQFTGFKYNVLLNTGINELFTLICSATAGTRWNNANAHLGAGDNSLAESAAHTDLQATINKFYKPMMTGFPIYGTGQKAVWRSSFAGTEANYAWAEFVVRNGLVAGVCLNRKVSAQGTKVSGQIWELELTITLT